MNQYKTRRGKIIDYIPVIGILLFLVLFIFSSTLYPGGSQADLNTIGFDWVNNYWCNLMNEKGMNGQHNPARPYSILAWIILCLGTMVFFIQFANAFSKSTVWKLIIKIGGVISLFFAMLIFTQFHDLMTTLSSIFGIAVVCGVIKEIYGSNLFYFKIGGTLCILLLGLNNYIYYTQHYLTILPILQKITFIIVLSWIAGLSYNIGKRNLNDR